ncbi:sulfite exporter TauE/SafE family protein [Ketobacter sp. MCCC 1A13808]|uniref:sulfite exporter TauE/SafE family protein n=1 Tax=Ketobacter sp. MCCC 1A13808 TaxID=2602738 RepID=UPI000F1CFEBC|nr:sulfite exporter TauE/SafE family protein [Ketobacter sp. MCCC 1A13808]MVF12676.1 sulfite exporter TauE/SafE family protein [Ketobacter sp. MCCC 1A13808]RLP55529.1 MAG: sulfite exporter TauE/SafE family protein [Ketobacter sp.]
MQFSYDLVAAFAIGFMGSLHCVGMCGGISGALTSAIAPGQARRTRRLLGYQLLYSLGRISSYACAGFLVGFAGSSIYATFEPSGPSYLRIFAGLMMILLGCYLSGWWKILNQLERLGAQGWKHIAPYTKNLLPVDRPIKAVALGFLWGWLPCGLVYSALAWSLGSGDAISGALLMVYFGLGTLPALIGIGTFSHLLQDISQSRGVRIIAALSLIGFGIWTIASQFMGHAGHTGHH